MSQTQTHRKFQTEFTLVITVVGASLLRASDLLRVEEPEERSHLYILSSTPTVSVDPTSVVISTDALAGKVQVHDSGDVLEHDFVFRHRGEVARWHSEWPYSDFEVRSAGGDILIGGPAGLLGHLGAAGWPTEASAHEVLYVGQSFGSDGSRTAFQRLQSHETLQRILAERRPDREIWLTLASIIDIQVVSETVPTEGGESDGQADKDHIGEVYQYVHSEGFRDGEAVSIAEAGLIRGFKPQYNQRLKETFPAPTQKSLETLRGLDFHSLVVEWQATNVHEVSGFSVDRYKSDTVPPSAMAFFSYTIHTEAGRAATLMFDKQMTVPPAAPDADTSPETAESG